MVNIEYEKDLGESASEALVYTLNQLALEIAKDESLRAHILGQKTLLAVQPQEKQELTSTPATAPAAKAADQPQAKPKLASFPKEAPVMRVRLRRQPKAIRNQVEIRRILVKYNFFEISMNTNGSFVNDLVDNNDGTVTDKATRLIWQKSGSLERLENRDANNYVKQLNSKHFAGYSDWRMPTIEELASILARSRNKGVHLAPAFDYKQTRCWTVDQQESRYSNRYLSAWIIDFQNGEVSQAIWHRVKVVPYYGTFVKNPENYVKAVRSVK
jgi:hypothetical protein